MGTVIGELSQILSLKSKLKPYTRPGISRVIIIFSSVRVVQNLKRTQENSWCCPSFVTGHQTGGILVHATGVHVISIAGTTVTLAYV